MTTTTHYAAIQIDTRTVYGVGTNHKTAADDARRYLGPGPAAAAFELTQGWATVPCTAAAAAYVREHGGQPSPLLTVSRSGVCLRSEEE
jgi:hypothetical protein